MKSYFYLFTVFTLLFIFSSCEEEEAHNHDHETIQGCTDPLACNYNENATVDDNSCTYPEAGSDCDGNILTEIHTIFAGNFYYDPENITINVGDQVRWINDGGFHDVNGEINSITNTSFENPESFNSPIVSEVGAVIYTHTFNLPGVYNYDCSVGGHAQSGMVGTIIVED